MTPEGVQSEMSDLARDFLNGAQADGMPAKLALNRLFSMAAEAFVIAYREHGTADCGGDPWNGWVTFGDGDDTHEADWRVD